MLPNSPPNAKLYGELHPTQSHDANAKRMQRTDCTECPNKYLPISERGYQSESYIHKEANVQQEDIQS